MTAKRAQARRALQRQLDYQRKKALQIRGAEWDYVAAIRERSAHVRAALETLRPLRADARVLEVGSGAHGLIFFFNAPLGVGCDPLACEYAALFPAWQRAAKTIAARGESLPFADAVFDLVVCDNVVDHAEDPGAIVAELSRVLTPGGLLFFTVNVHHPVYDVASRLHAAWNAAGIPLEIRPFADHTVHLTLDAARRLFSNLPFRMVVEHYDVAEARARARKSLWIPPELLKAVFYKNVRLELVAVRTS